MICEWKFKVDNGKWEIQKKKKKSNWKFGKHLEIQKTFGNLKMICKFGENLEFWKKFGNVAKNQKFGGEGKLEIWGKFGNFEEIWTQIGYL